MVIVPLKPKKRNLKTIYLDDEYDDRDKCKFTYSPKLQKLSIAFLLYLYDKSGKNSIIYIGPIFLCW